MSISLASKDSPLWNKDFEPIESSRKTWSKWTMMFLWISMSINVPAYMLGSGLVESGLNIWQAVITMFIGCLIVLIPMVLVAAIGVKYGVPFPVIVRSSFGTQGAKLIAIFRALVACGWFGIQSYIAGNALFIIVTIFFPIQKYDFYINYLDIYFYRLICFLIIVLLQVIIIKHGMEMVKKVEVYASLFLLLMGVLLLFWAFTHGGGFANLIKASSSLSNKSDIKFIPLFLVGLTAVVGFWSTLSLNIPDFSRFVKSQKDQIIGQSVGMPFSMTFISFIGIVTTSATIIMFGKVIWDPVALIQRLDNSFIMILPLVGIIVATISCNVGANLVSSSNDFSNLYPKIISFKYGGYIACIIGVFILPWKLIDNNNSYIFKWLLSYSALLGAVGGVMISDYFIVKKRKICSSSFFKKDGDYKYTSGWHIKAFVAIFCGVIPNLPGFLFRIGLFSDSVFFKKMGALYDVAWFISFFVAFFIYIILCKIKIINRKNQSS